MLSKKKGKKKPSTCAKLSVQRKKEKKMEAIIETNEFLQKGRGVLKKRERAAAG